MKEPEKQEESKPDFWEMAKEHFAVVDENGVPVGKQPVAIQHGCYFGMQKIWDAFVIPLQSQLSSLKKENEELRNFKEYHEHAVDEHVKNIREIDRLKLIVPDLCKEIPITEEWLLKFGFVRGDNKKKSDSFYRIAVGGSELFINPNNGVVWIERGDNIFNNPALIQSVHQLQNLYSALTGSELTLKETSPSKA